MWEWIRSMVLPFLPRLVELEMLEPADAERFRALWTERERDPHSIFCSPPVFDVIGRRR